MKLTLTLFFSCLLTFSLFSNSSSIDYFQLEDMDLQISAPNNLDEIILFPYRLPSDSSVHKTKLIAVALAITLGAFGVHRLYLGTEPIVPIAYTLTLGGGFLILPLIDVFYILAAKDINQITNNNNVFIWNKDLSETTNSVSTP